MDYHGFDAHAVYRQSGVDRLDEDIARAVFGLLDDEAEVGDQDEAGVLDAVALIVVLAGFFTVGLGIGIARIFVFLGGGDHGADA